MGKQFAQVRKANQVASSSSNPDSLVSASLHITHAPGFQDCLVWGGAIPRVGTREERVDSALDMGSPLDSQFTVLAPGTST